MKFWMIGSGALLALVFLAGCKLTRAGYESADYKVVRRSGAFEIRDYPALTLVSTPMTAQRSTDDESFMKLFRYIGGANEAESRIAMTTPVFSDQDGTNRQMSFVVPKKVAAAGAPKAKRDDIAVQTRPAGRFAAYRFSGSWGAERAASARQKLADWIAAEKLQPIGDPQMANYDPPFTPAFLRRNEVMMRVKEASVER
jgi:hypothetical protein